MDLNLCGNGKTNKQTKNPSVCPEFHSLLRNMKVYMCINFICPYSKKNKNILENKK